MSIRVVIADDQALVRAGFAALLDAQDDIEVVGEAANGEEAVRLARELGPDVVLMDIRMPVLDGLAATREIAAAPELSEVRVVVLTTFELDEYVFEAMRAGATGFLVKHTEPADLVKAVRVVADGDALLSPSVTRRLVARTHRARTRGHGPRRRGPHQCRNRPAPLPEPRYRADSRQPHSAQTRCARPDTTGGAGVRIRPRPTRLAIASTSRGW